MVNFCFLDQDINGKALVFCENNKECLRRRYSKIDENKNYSITKKSLPHIPFMFGNPQNFLSFFKTMYQNITLSSYKGSSASQLHIVKNIQAFSFVKNELFQNAMVIIGTTDHCYMLRFSFDNQNFYLSDVYEIDPKIAKGIEQEKIIPHSSEWDLCEVCCQKTTMHCKKCQVMYCSKRCQKLDWNNHKSICSQTRTKTKTDSARESICHECN